MQTLNILMLENKLSLEWKKWMNWLENMQYFFQVTKLLSKHTDQELLNWHKCPANQCSGTGPWESRVSMTVTHDEFKQKDADLAIVRDQRVQLLSLDN